MVMLQIITGLYYAQLLGTVRERQGKSGCLSCARGTEEPSLSIKDLGNLEAYNF